MATLPNPIDETYIDFLKRKFQGRNFSPEFRARNPGYFDMRGEDAPPTKATWETYYRKAKPKTSATSSQDDGGMLSPLDGGPPALGFWDDPGLFGDQNLKGLGTLLKEGLGDLRHGINTGLREAERGWNEFTTGFPDYRSQDSIEKQQGYNLDEGLMQLPADLVPGYRDTNMSLDEELLPPIGDVVKDDGTRKTIYYSNIYEDSWNKGKPTPHAIRHDPIIGHAGIDNKYSRPERDASGEIFNRNRTFYPSAYEAEKWGPMSLVAQEEIKEGKENYVDPLFPNLDGVVGRFIKDEILNPVESRWEELQKEANKLWDEGPVNYVEKWAKNLDTKDVVSGAIGGVTKLLGLPMLPAWGIGNIGEMVMSEGHGQIGMPGTVMSDYYGDNRGTETISTVHGFADVPGVGVVAVDAQGRPLGGTGPQSGVYSYAFPGAGATPAGQEAYDTDGRGFEVTDDESEGGSAAYSEEEGYDDIEVAF